MHNKSFKTFLSIQYQKLNMIKGTKIVSEKLCRSKLRTKSNDLAEIEEDSMPSSPSLKKFSLSGNQLCGSIFIGNYNYLTQLEVSENEMEVLDLSSLTKLETLKCSRNKLMELVINGKNLTSLVADNNSLYALSVTPAPTRLIHFNISHNHFTDLPNWLGACSNLNELLANHNQLQVLTEFFASYKIHRLQRLNLAYNNVRTLSSHKLPESFESIEYLELQSNELRELPDNFFEVTRKKLIVLNASCNKLTEITERLERNNYDNQMWRLEELYLSNNQCNERIFDEIFIHATRLRVIHAAYNLISVLSEACISNWSDLEVLVLSGNVLQYLPQNVATLHKLQVLRLHSNLLLSTATLCELDNLKVLDLAHNHLDRINLLSITPKNLKHLDLSCNLQLKVDADQVKVCQSKRNWSLIDVSGKNRACLPTTTMTSKIHNDCDFKESSILKSPWNCGFSEATGQCRRLLVSQLRLCNYGSSGGGLFGMFESAVSGLAAKTLSNLIPQILMDEKTIKKKVSEYMKYTLLTAHQQLINICNVETHQQVSATLCHITKEQFQTKDHVRSQKAKKYILRVASVGNIGAYLVRKTTNVCLTMALSDRIKQRLQISPFNSSMNDTFPDPDIMEVALSNEDEYLVICNGDIWTFMDIEQVAREVRKEENAVLAAKRIQDIAQSFGASGNLSIIVVRFRNIGTDVEHLIKELKEKSVRKKLVAALPLNVQCKRTCCDRSNACRHRLLEIERQTPILSTRQCFPTTARSDRTSPSGQSDTALSPIIQGVNNSVGDKGYILSHSEVLEEKNELEMLGETDSVLSEEQFKCWEYMLEQNTQLLFDKELNTISKSFTKNSNLERKSNHKTDNRIDCKSNLMQSVNRKIISTSLPQLLYSEVKKAPLVTLQQQVSLLSKHFDSSRSFQQSSSETNTTFPHSFIPKNCDSISNSNDQNRIGGGHNAAYFGSLQRLIPYNLDYDFAVTQERAILDEDYGENDSRMRKYWGVATTEL